MAKRTKKRKEIRSRRTIKMFFDIGKQIEAELYEAATYLRSQRLLAPTLRQGFKLFIDLQNAEYQLQCKEEPSFNALSFFEGLFPNVVQHMVKRYHSDELTKLREQMAALQARLEMASVPPPSPKLLSGFKAAPDPVDDDEPIAPVGPKSLKSRPTPLDDDDDDIQLEIKKAKVDTLANFMNGMLNFGG